jgi:Glucose / Sorbosone dehydrogenase
VRMLRPVFAIAASLSLLTGTAAHAASLEPIGSFDQPIYVTSDLGSAERLFVVEREGEIRLLQGGRESTFADLRPEVACGGECKGERGLLSIALDPRFDYNRKLFVDYANSETGAIYVDELEAKPDLEEAEPLSSAPALQPLLVIPHSEAANHNGGQLQFGPEGDLFISTGDGGGENDQFHNAQSTGSLLGKILRIDPNRSGGYTVPAGNPFASASHPYNTIWSYGLRNPFRFSFDRLTGAMLIGDVGQSAREEVDYAPQTPLGIAAGAGTNYGWNCREGLIAGPGTDPVCSPTPPPGTFTDPIFDYEHTPEGPGGESRCAIIGGYIARDHSLGDLYGRYVYGDLCSGEIRSFEVAHPSATDRSEGMHVEDLNSFGEDSCGRLYAVSGEGEVYRLVGAAAAECPEPVSQPMPTTTGFLYVGIKAQRRHVPRGKSAVLTVWVSPCAGHKGKPVRLLRNGHLNGSRYLGRACTTRFLRRVHRNTTFAATLEDPENGADLAESRHLKIRIRRHRWG